MSDQGYQKVLKVISKLRDPDGGCPWDLKQDHQSLKQYLIEECYEVISAIEENDSVKIEVLAYNFPP